MDVIDEKGRVFGVVNVVDALVVLVVLAMVLAGVALATGGTEEAEPDPQPTRYATISFEVPSGSDAATLASDDTLTLIDGDETFEVEDTYHSFAPDGDVHVVASVQYRGQFTTNGGTLYGGDSVDLTTGSYRLDADVVAVNQTQAAIPTTAEQAVLFINQSRMIENAIEAGDTASIGDTDVATVTAVDRRQTESGEQNVLVGVDITVWDSEPVPTYDGNPVRVDSRLTVVTDRAAIRGRLAAVGTDDPQQVETG